MAFLVDDPGTAYDESETPINLAIPVVIEISASSNPLVHLKIVGIVVRKLLRLDHSNGSVKFASMVRRGTSASNSRMKFLCRLSC